MSLFVDKYRPKTLSTLTFHPELTVRLEKMVEAGDFPHILFYGPPGSGKKTRIAALLRQVYGNGVEKVRIEQRQFHVPGKSKVIELTTLASSYHIELNPSDAGSSDRVIVQDIVKEMASSVPLDGGVAFKVLVLHDAHALSKSAQHALRRTLEKYAGTCRVLMSSSQPSKLLEPLRSRCLCLRVSSPNVGQLDTMLQRVCQSEHIDNTLISHVLLHCRRNARRALLSLQVRSLQSSSSSPASIIRPDWELQAIACCRECLRECSAQQALRCRQRLYELLGHCVPSGDVLKVMTMEAVRTTDAALTPAIVQLASHTDTRLRQGSKPIFHLEAFILRLMALHQNWVQQLMQGM